MSQIPITLIAKDYDYLAPLACGDVVAEGIDLTLDRATSMLRVVEDPAIPAGELSFSGFLMRFAQGDRSFVGIPFFAYRAFRQRCFFIPRGSGLTSLKDLEGRRVGTNAWPDTGNTWTRAALREQGVAIDRIDWWVGGIDDPNYDSWGGRPKFEVPPYVHALPSGRSLREMLLAGDLDALMIPLPPKGFKLRDYPMVRLIPDYRRAEREYFLRTGVYPGHHIFGLRREVFEQTPWVARRLFEALEKSRLHWQERRRGLAELTPWLQVELEETIDLFGEDWHANGVEPNRQMIQTLCEEEYAQGLISQPLDPAAVFADFEQAMKG